MKAFCTTCIRHHQDKYGQSLCVTPDQPANHATGALETGMVDCVAKNADGDCTEHDPIRKDGVTQEEFQEATQRVISESFGPIAIYLRQYSKETEMVRQSLVRFGFDDVAKQDAAAFLYTQEWAPAFPTAPAELDPLLSGQILPFLRLTRQNGHVTGT